MIKSIMYKQCGHANERIVLIYRGYDNKIIRWGREEVVEAVMKSNKGNDDGYEFLY
jgi:hypothetical protein